MPLLEGCVDSLVSCHALKKRQFEQTQPSSYALVGGPAAPDSEMKYELLAVLSKEIREQLLWHSSEVKVSFAEFRDVVQAQTAKVLLSRGGPGVNALEEQFERDAALKAVLEKQLPPPPGCPGTTSTPP